MEPRANHVLIGAFTLAVLAGAMLFGAWLARSGPGDGSRVYEVVFHEAVTGLSVGSDVLYSGIPVGEVESLELDPEDPRRVRARIKVDATTPIDAGTSARLSMPNITGITVIQLRGGAADARSLPVTDDGVPVIEATPSPIARLRGNSEELLAGITTLVERGNALLSTQNLANLRRTLANIEAATAVLAEERESVRVMLRETTGAVTEANQAMADIRLLIDEHGNGGLASAAAAMASLERTARRAERVLADNEPALRNGMQALNDAGPALRELRDTLATLRDIARRLEDDPASYLLGRDTIDEFEP
ncbi:MAG: MlaD family protein [Pseudomonadota bacterium]